MLVDTTISVGLVGSLHVGGSLAFLTGAGLFGQVTVQTVSGGAFALVGSSFVQINTTGQLQTVTGPPTLTIPAGPMVLAHLDGNLNLLNDTAHLIGTFDLTLSATGFAMDVHASLGLGTLGSLNLSSELEFKTGVGLFGTL